jgi:hypothetical protein
MVKPLTVEDLASIVDVRLKDAEVLLASHRLEGARYLCGYAVEIALKLRIVKTLDWDSFPPSDRKNFEGLSSFKTHDLPALLKMSGWERRITDKFRAEWDYVKIWNEESRYIPPGLLMPEVKAFVDSSRLLVQELMK